MRVLPIVGILIALVLVATPGISGKSYHTISCDGDMNDWTSDENMGTVNSATFYVTFDFANLYFGFHRGSTDNDMFIALDVRSGGSEKSINWSGVHTLPFKADYYVAIENHSYAYLKEYRDGKWQDLAPLSRFGSYIEDWNVNIEIKIPLKVLGFPKRVNILAYGQWENAVNVWAVWPVTNPMGKGPQNFTNYISLPIKDGVVPADYRYGVKFAKPKFNIDGYLTDWSGDSNLTKIVDSSEDSAGDKVNVVENEVYSLYVTWDNNYLYIGYEYRTGVWGNSIYDNGTMVFIDADSPWKDGTTSLNHMNVWPRKINFGNFLCEYFYGKWDAQRGNFYHVLSENYSKDISSNIIVASTGGNGVRGDVEMAIPWWVLYGKNYRSVMYNTTGVKISLAVVGHDNETALDTIPDVGSVTKDTNFTDEVTIDYFFNTGKIFTPPPLKIENLTYNVTNGSVDISWKTNHISRCVLQYERQNVTENYTFNYSSDFQTRINGVTYGNITINAYDVYGNHVQKVISIEKPKKPEENNTSVGHSMWAISPVELSIIGAISIVAGGESYLWLRRKKK
ncbi:MAG: hypothetical protein GXO25_01625 [Euryarchaeota archaeon]|nr:hypothetical protein [Euryarchaeota archaeon]